jgi:penicillin-binding protein 2
VGSGSVVEYKQEITRTVHEEKAYLDIVHEGLSGVIYRESEAQTSHFTNLSVKVAGKTGSAETANSQPTGWFIAYAPSDNPKYVVAAVVENGGFGSEGAMYVARDLLGALYNEPDSSSAAATGAQ